MFILLSYVLQALFCKGKQNTGKTGTFIFIIFLFLFFFKQMLLSKASLSTCKKYVHIISMLTPWENGFSLCWCFALPVELQGHLCITLYSVKTTHCRCLLKYDHIPRLSLAYHCDLLFILGLFVWTVDKLTLHRQNWKHSGHQEIGMFYWVARALW